MTHVMIVESDANIVAVLRASFHQLYPNWDIRFVNSGEEALELMEDRPIDVVVTQASLVGITGAELLSIVRFQSPGVTRILMADINDSASLAAAAVQAHRVLLNPVNPKQLGETIVRTHALQQVLEDPELQEMVSSMEMLPRPSQAVRSLNELINRPGVSALQVARTIERDPSMTAKLLSIINTAYYGLSHHVTEVSEAVAYLGLDVVRNICVSNELMRSLTPESPFTASAVSVINEHSSAVAHIARELMTDRRAASNAYVAGLLADVGLLLLATHEPEKLLALQVHTMRSNLPITEVELEVFGVHHAHLGAALLRLWGIPDAIIEAVASHHDAQFLPGSSVDMAHAVHIAECLVSSRNARDHDADEVEWNHGEDLDGDYLERVGAAELIANLGMSTREG